MGNCLQTVYSELEGDIIKTLTSMLNINMEHEITETENCIKINYTKVEPKSPYEQAEELVLKKSTDIINDFINILAKEKIKMQKFTIENTIKDISNKVFWDIINNTFKKDVIQNMLSKYGNVYSIEKNIITLYSGYARLFNSFEDKQPNYVEIDEKLNKIRFENLNYIRELSKQIKKEIYQNINFDKITQETNSIQISLNKINGTSVSNINPDRLRKAILNCKIKNGTIDFKHFKFIQVNISLID